MIRDAKYEYQNTLKRNSITMILEMFMIFVKYFGLKKI